MSSWLSSARGSDSRRRSSTWPPRRSRGRSSAGGSTTRPGDEFVGTQLEIAGSELTNEQAAVFGRVLGREVTFRRLPMPVVRVAMGKELFQMFRWFNDSGYQADIPGLRARYPELELRTLEDWRRDEGWEDRRVITKQRDKLGRLLPSALRQPERSPQRVQWSWSSALTSRDIRATAS